MVWLSIQVSLALANLSLLELFTKEEVREGDRVIVLRLNLHQSLNFPLLHFEARLLGKKFVHKQKNDFL